MTATSAANASTRTGATHRGRPTPSNCCGARGPELFAGFCARLSAAAVLGGNVFGDVYGGIDADIDDVAVGFGKGSGAFAADPAAGADAAAAGAADAAPVAAAGTAETAGAVGAAGAVAGEADAAGAAEAGFNPSSASGSHQIAVHVMHAKKCFPPALNDRRAPSQHAHSTSTTAPPWISS